MFHRLGVFCKVIKVKEIPFGWFRATKSHAIPSSNVLLLERASEQITRSNWHNFVDRPNICGRVGRQESDEYGEANTLMHEGSSRYSIERERIKKISLGTHEEGIHHQSSALSFAMRCYPPPFSLPLPLAQSVWWGGCNTHTQDMTDWMPKEVAVNCLC